MVKLIYLIIFGLWAVACAPERTLPESTALSSDANTTSTGTSTLTSTQTNTTVTPQQGQYLGWGANVGSGVVMKAVADCNSAKHFYDRAAAGGRGICDVNKSVPFKCTSIEETKANLKLDEDQAAQIDTAMAGALAGYKFDQCVDDLTEYKVYMVLVNGNNSLTFTYIPIEK